MYEFMIGKGCQQTKPVILLAELPTGEINLLLAAPAYIGVVVFFWNFSLIYR
jgi:hypothetical protein